MTEDGGEFENEIWHELCRILGMDKRKTSSYHPSCTGAVKCILNSLLGKTVQVNPREWPERLTFVVAAYNSSVSDATGYTPNFLMFVRKLSAAVDLVLGSPSDYHTSVNDYVDPSGGSDERSLLLNKRTSQTYSRMG